MVISLTLVEIFFAGSTLVAAAALACVGSYTVASIEARWITYRHTIYSVSWISLFTFTRIRAKCVCAKRILVTQSLISFTLINFGTIPFIDTAKATHAVTVKRAMSIYALCVCITVMSMLSATLNTLIYIYPMWVSLLLKWQFAD